MSCRTNYGRRLRLLTLIDEFTRKCLVIDVGRNPKQGCSGTPQRSVHSRGTPDFIRSDNGAEFAAKRIRTSLENHSTANCVISCSTPKSSTRSWKPECSQNDTSSLQHSETAHWAPDHPRCSYYASTQSNHHIKSGPITGAGHRSALHLQDTGIDAHANHSVASRTDCISLIYHPIGTGILSFHRLPPGPS